MKILERGVTKVLHFSHMATKKRRLNLSLPPEIDEALTIIAKRDGVPRATIALKLLEDALETLEDEVLGKIAEERLNDPQAEYLSHEEVWSKLLK